MFRPMLRKKQELGREDCLRLLREEKRGVLSVIGDGGYPYGVPMNHYYCEEDGKLYFHGGAQGHKLDALRRNDKASFCVMDGGSRTEGDWALHFQSVVVFGRVEFVEDRETLLDLARRLSRKFTSDEDYIEREICASGERTVMFSLTIEHMSGKRVTES